jgi:hypothetical protein
MFLRNVGIYYESTWRHNPEEQHRQRHVVPRLIMHGLVLPYTLYSSKTSQNRRYVEREPKCCFITDDSFIMPHKMCNYRRITFLNPSRYRQYIQSCYFMVTSGLRERRGKINSR